MNNIFDYAGLLAGNMWLYGGTFILVLSILVFVHEWGHYIVARMCGVKIETFSIGFGKELFGFNDKSGTRWKFSLFPLGGYVQMFGDSDPSSFSRKENKDEGDSNSKVVELSEEEKKVAFYAQPVWQRSAIVFAGPAVNFLFAIMLFFFVFLFYGQEVTPPVVSGVFENSAAERGGILPGDIILSMGGKKIGGFQDVQVATAVALDTKTDITVLRNGEEVTLSVRPDLKVVEDRFGFRHSHGLLGIIGSGQSGVNFALDRIHSVNGVVYDDKDAIIEFLRNQNGEPFYLTVEKNANESGHNHNHSHGENDHYEGENEAEHEHEHHDHSEIGNNENKEISYETVHMKAFADENGKYFSVEKVAGKDYLIVGGYIAGNNRVEHNIFSAFTASVEKTRAIVRDTMMALGQMIVGVRSPNELGGIIRIGAVAGDMANMGFIPLITFAALLSINLGLINLFPIPVLDGGHLVFYAVEAVKGSPVPEKVQEFAFSIGMVLIVGLMLFANLNDIVQIFGLGS